MFEIKLQLKIIARLLRECLLTGISEILVLVLLITSILILPRLFKGEKPAKKRSSFKKSNSLTAKIRFGIVLTLIYPIAAALYLKPWNENLIPYISYGIIPVVIVWAVVWIIAGRKK